jgi:hypothetical protein
MWTHGPKKNTIAGSVKVQVYKAHRNQMDNQRRRVFFYGCSASEFCVVWPVRFKTVRQLRGVSKVVRIRKKRRDVRSVVINRLGVR